MKRNPTFYTSRDDGHYHSIDLDFEESEPPPMDYNNNVDWGHIGKRALVPLSGIADDDFTPNQGGGLFWTVVSAAGAGLSSYHGYKRNAAENPIAWALWWGLWGSVLPIITLPIAIAQGFAEPSE